MKSLNIVIPVVDNL